MKFLNLTVDNLSKDALKLLARAKLNQLLDTKVTISEVTNKLNIIGNRISGAEQTN